MQSLFNSIIVSLAKAVVLPLVGVLSLAGYHFNNVTPVAKAPIVLGGYNPSGGGTYRLQSSVGISATTINLSSFKEPISNLPYTMAYLNTSVGYGTLDPQTSNRSEFVSFTGITQNSDGTAQLTGLTRGLSRTPGTGGCVASTTLTQSHSGQSIFILSNSPCFYSEYAVKRNDETISGYWSLPTPLSPANPATKDYVDTHVNGGTISNAIVAVPGIAGETVASGTIMYLKQADARWYKASVSTSEASSSIVGISQGNGTAGNTIASGVLLAGYDSNQSGLTAGRNYFISSTAGSLSTASSTRFVGRARDATSIYFAPDIFANGLFDGVTGRIRNTAISTSTLYSNLALIESTSTLMKSSGTWTKPSNSFMLCITVIGGGGGGGMFDANNGTSGGGGGGESSGCYSSDLASSSVAYTVGAAGVGAIVSGNGTDGGTTTMSIGNFTIGAGGGKKGTNVESDHPVGGFAVGGQGNITGGNGGGSIDGFGVASGGGGGGGGSQGVPAGDGGSNVGGSAGAAGTQSPDLGAGSAGMASNSSNASNASDCGGGGGGGTGGHGGNGGSGCIRLTTFYKTSWP